MKCINCGSEDILSFFTEHIPCSHCGEMNEISYNTCQDCGLIWKAIDGEIINGAVFTEPEIGNMLDDAMSSFMGWVDGIPEEASPPGTMEEVVFKCLKCNTIAYEIDPNVYHCPECGFEWEVI